MAAFHVDKAFYYARLDAVLLSGVFVDTDEVGEGWTVDLPAAVKGHGPVPIHEVSSIQFADGSVRKCLVLKYEVFADAPLLEFGDLEGLTLALERIVYN